MLARVAAMLGELISNWRSVNYPANRIRRVVVIGIERKLYYIQAVRPDATTKTDCGVF